jgi:hypothetical protein
MLAKFRVSLWTVRTSAIIANGLQSFDLRADSMPLNGSKIAESSKIFECWEILSVLINTYHSGQDADCLTLQQIWKDLPYSIGIFCGMDFKNSLFEGILLKKD